MNFYCQIKNNFAVHFTNSQTITEIETAYYKPQFEIIFDSNFFKRSFKYGEDF